MSTRLRKWYKLDNAAKLFPTALSKRTTTFFRLCAALKERIDVQYLQEALDRIIIRFPYYRVELKSGLFWNYLDENRNLPAVTPDMHHPCSYMPVRKKGRFLFRVVYFRNRIAVEFCHVLTDGSGALIFLKSLLAEYYRLKGFQVGEYDDIYSPVSPVDQAEEEDAFRKFYKRKLPYPDKIKRAYHIGTPLLPVGEYGIITGFMPVDKLLQVSRGLNVSITEFLTAVYIEALQDDLFAGLGLLPKILPVRVMVPVNLRKIYSSRTMRNFSLYVIPGIDPRLGRYTFQEILDAVYHHMRVEVNDKVISQQISRNMTGEIHPLGRIMPLILKELIGSLLYNHLGEYLYSGVLTNLGSVSLPPELAEHVDWIEFIPTPSPVLKTTCAVISYGNILCASFGSVADGAEIEKLFFTKLVKHGIPIKIRSNR